MKNIQIGNIIQKKRKERGLTQEELAEAVGVSKPTVSKWESGQCYPDITLLPVLASFFGISVDQLIDYRPQLSREEIRQIYIQLSDEFAKEGFDSVYPKLQELIRKYYSCWPFLFNMAQLLFNQISGLGSEQKMQQILQDAQRLYRRVEELCEDAYLAGQAREAQAAMFIMLNEPDKALELLEGRVKPSISADMLSASAYVQKGDRNRAELLYQKHIFYALLDLLSNIQSIIALYRDQPESAAQWIASAEQTALCFKMQKTQPSGILGLYLNGAMVFAQSQDADYTLELLEKYVQIVTSSEIYPIRLRNGGLFTRVKEAFEEDLDLGVSPPRDERMIRKSYRDAVVSQPIFSFLSENKQFQKLVQRLEQIV